MGAEGTRSNTGAWAVAAAAAALLAVTQGFRSSLGLFLSPINTASAAPQTTSPAGAGLVAHSIRD